MDVISLTGLKAEIIPPHHTITYSDQHLEGETFPTGQTTCEDGYFEDQNANISKLGRFLHSNVVGIPGQKISCANTVAVI